jgi:cell wall-associated NlpC family hydrolase
VSKNKFISLVLLLIVSLYITGCYSGSDYDETYEVQSNRKVKNAEEFAGVSGIQKKSLITENSLEKLSNIVSEYSNSSELRDAVMYKIIELMNTPYLWGGMTSNGIDCSAFCQTVMIKALGIEIPRTSIMQSTVGEEIRREDLKFGDLIFFNTRGNRISHVGIYIGEGIFAHSSSSGGVKTSSLDEAYYNARYVTARRVIKEQ